MRQLTPGKYQYEYKSLRSGRVSHIDNREITIVCRILGCPTDKRAGMYVNRKLEETVDKGDILYTLYSTDQWRLKEAVETIKNMPVFNVE